VYASGDQDRVSHFVRLHWPGELLDFAALHCTTPSAIASTSKHTGRCITILAVGIAAIIVPCTDATLCKLRNPKRHNTRRGCDWPSFCIYRLVNSGSGTSARLRNSFLCYILLQQDIRRHLVVRNFICAIVCAE